jgi:hypothetical protein
LIPEWWRDAPSSRKWTSVPAAPTGFPTALGVVDAEFREVDPPERHVHARAAHGDYVYLRVAASRTPETASERASRA